MTRIDFHVNAPGQVAHACRLLRKIHRAGQRAVVFGPPDVIAELDRSLWTFSALDFIPHVDTRDALAAQTPILLCSEMDTAPELDLLVSLSPEPPPGFSRFERLIEVVSDDPEQLEAARGRWRHYRERGYALTRHDLARADA
jgi:DNA polymerase-3 subunit chi